MNEQSNETFIKIFNKMLHFKLNMYYPINNIEAETNFYLEKVINDFIIKYQNSTNKIFILEYKDDIISLINYKILQVISAIMPIDIKLLGKIKNTKKFFKKSKIKCIPERKFIKYISDDMIFLSGFNPIYKVIKPNIDFKQLDNSYNLIEKFTPMQLATIAKFYNIDYNNFDIVCAYAQQFNLWCNDCTAWNDTEILKYFYNDISFIENFPKLSIVNLTSNINDNMILLNQIENTNNLVLYNFPDDNKDQVIEQLKQFSFFINNNSNAYVYYNSNLNSEIIDYYKLFMPKDITYITKESD